MFIAGIVGQMFAQLAVVMIVTICASLFVALTATPTLSARFIKPSESGGVSEEDIELKWWEKRYVGALTASIARPWLTLISAVGIAIVTVVLLGLLGTDFLPKDDQGQLAYTLELPVGTSKEKTLDVADVYVNELRNNQRSVSYLFELEPQSTVAWGKRKAPTSLEFAPAWYVQMTVNAVIKRLGTIFLLPLQDHQKCST